MPCRSSSSCIWPVSIRTAGSVCACPSRLSSDDRVLVDVGIPTRQRPDLVRLAIDSVLAQDLTAWRLRHLGERRRRRRYRGRGRPVPEGSADPLRRYGRRVGRRRELDAADPGGRGAVRRAPARRRPLGSDLPRPAGRVPGREPVLRVRLLREQGDRRDRRGRARDRVRPAEGTYQPEALFPILYKHNVIGPPSILVRRDAYDAVGAYFDSEFFPFWDYEMWLRLAARFPAGYLTVRDCSYRMHDVRMTFTVRQFGTGYLQTIDRADELLESVPEHRGFASSAPPPACAGTAHDCARLLRGGRAAQRRPPSTGGGAALSQDRARRTLSDGARGPRRGTARVGCPAAGALRGPPSRDPAPPPLGARRAAVVSASGGPPAPRPPSRRDPAAARS